MQGLAADVVDHKALLNAINVVGTIDHLVFTAGSRSGPSPLPTLDEGVLEAAFETKLFSAVHAIRLALPHLAAEASVTFTSGQISRRHGVGSFVKGAINAAVDAAGRHLAKELAPRRVNVISPGVVDTSQWWKPGSDTRITLAERLSASLPVKRIGTPAELAEAYLFAMTNGFVTGAVIDVDGGGLL